MARWAVVACDQFTSEPEYWEKVERHVGDAPSAFRIVLPELYLEHPGDIPVDRRIEAINQSMDRYLASGVFRDMGPGIVVLDRRTCYHPSRVGVVLAIHLDDYEYVPGAGGLVRATEGTVLERIPPRLRIRKDAALEIPHVQLLVDDPGRTAIEPLLRMCRSGDFPVAYTAELFPDGGQATGWFVPYADSSGKGPAAIAGFLRALSRLASFHESGFLFAVGDGNHSLATAKAHWEALKAAGAPDGHPASMAMVEVVNLHDPGLEFEAIHRIVFGAGLQALREALESVCGECGCGLHFRSFQEPGRAVRYSAGCDPDVQAIPMTDGQAALVMIFRDPPHPMAVGSLQILLDAVARRIPVRIDYIHGEETLLRLCGPQATGFFLPRPAKSGLFGAVARDGVLPRKSFSMGEACEKRYYVESRRIVSVDAETGGHGHG